MNGLRPETIVSGEGLETARKLQMGQAILTVMPEGVPELPDNVVPLRKPDSGLLTAYTPQTYLGREHFRAIGEPLGVVPIVAGTVHRDLVRPFPRIDQRGKTLAPLYDLYRDAGIMVVSRVMAGMRPLSEYPSSGAGNQVVTVRSVLTIAGSSEILQAIGGMGPKKIRALEKIAEYISSNMINEAAMSEDPAAARHDDSADHYQDEPVSAGLANRLLP